MDIESRFTPANEFCPHPEHWHSPDSEATEEEITALIAALVGAIQPEFVVETGSYHGHTSLAIGLQLKKNGHGRLESIEKDDNAFLEARRYVLTHDSELPVTMLHMNTMAYTPPRDIGFAFFDSWQEGRAEEFMRFHLLGRLNKDTIVAFHDSAPHHQVMKYVQPLEDEGVLKLLTIHSPRGLTIGQVL